MFLTAAAMLAMASSARARGQLRPRLPDRHRRPYMDAMAAQKPAGLPWADKVRYSENSVPMAIGDGLWGAISAHSTTALKVADPKTGEVVWIGETEEHGQPGFFAMR